jgi:hypothetical protein
MNSAFHAIWVVAPDIFGLFTFGKKQDGFPFRPGYIRAHFCTKRIRQTEESQNVLFNSV